MGQFQLRLIEIPDDARPAVVEAARACGPPLDRTAFNSVLMGTRTLPTVIGSDDERAKVEALREILSKAGARLEISDQKTALALASLVEKVKGAPRNVQIGAGAGAAVLLVGVVALATGGDDAEPGPSGATATATVAGTATVARTATRAAPPPPPKPTPYADFLARLAPPAPACPPESKPFPCLLDKLRSVEPAALPEPAEAAQPDAGFDDAGASLAPPRPITVSTEEYLTALEHKFIRCLADEGGAPTESDQLRGAIAALTPALVYRFGQPPCTAGKRNMYDCLLAARASTCDEIHGRLLGAVIESQAQDRVLDWAARLADEAGDTILRCAHEERADPVDPLDRAHVHLLRYAIATTLERGGSGCGEEAYAACAEKLAADRCEDLADALYVDPATIIANLTRRCPSLDSCR